MKCRFGFNLFFALCFAWLLVPFVSNAATVSGYNTYYFQTTTNSVVGNNYSSTTSGLSFPTTTYTQIPAYNSSSQTYTVIRAMDLQFPTVEFVNGSTYTFIINFDYGSYVYPSWPNASNINTAFGIRSCPNGTCTGTITYQNDSTHQGVNTLQLKLVHKANANQTGKTFGIGPMTTNTGLFYNAYSSQQGIRINSATVDIVEDPNYQNTQDIINNQNQNTQTIINNQNINTQAQIDSQKVCNEKIIDGSSIINDNHFLNSSGEVRDSSFYGITDYIPFESIEVFDNTTSSYDTPNLCYYDNSKNLISCVPIFTLSVGNLNFPSSAKYLRTSFYKPQNIPVLKVYTCKNGNQALNDTLTDSSVNDSNINDFFDDLDFYDNNNFSSLITSPINFLNSLNDTCEPINLQLFGQTVSLPCGTSVFWERDLPYISTFRVFWNVLFGGALIYTLGLLLVKNISDAIDPTKDNIGGFKI